MCVCAYVCMFTTPQSRKGCCAHIVRWLREAGEEWKARATAGRDVSIQEASSFADVEEREDNDVEQAQVLLPLLILSLFLSLCMCVRACVRACVPVVCVCV
jgi:hypothetical protein